MPQHETSDGTLLTDRWLAGKMAGECISWRTHTKFDYVAMKVDKQVLADSDAAKGVWFITGSGRWFAGQTQFTDEQLLEILEADDIYMIWTMSIDHWKATTKVD